MKIKVLTFFNNANIGSELQAYSMNCFLNSAGYTDVTFIKRGYNGRIKKGIAFVKRKIKALFLHKDIKSLASVKQEYSKKHAIISTETKKKISLFSSQSLKTEYCNIASMRKQKDCAYLCGSDQIWSPLIYPIVKENFLACISREKKIAYAPSFGVNNLPLSFKHAVKKFISDFDYIAMREKEAAKTVSEMCSRKITTVVDPVFLVQDKCWYELAERRISSIDIFQPYVFCYFLDEPNSNTKKNIKEIVGDRKIIYICYKQYFEEFDNSIFLDVDPAEFLYLIKNSDMVITDSFHATAFSIIFEKSMRIYSRNQPEELRQDDRIRNLLNSLDIRLEIDDFNLEKNEIDYLSVKQKLLALSESSRAFLNDSLQKMDRSGGNDVS